MRWTRRWALAALALILAALAGATPARTQTVSEQVEHEFIYALDDRAGASNRIQIFQVDGVTGTVFPVGQPVETGLAGDGNELSSIQRLAFHPATRRLFVINDGASNTLSVYNVNTRSGALSFAYTLSLGPGAWTCVAVHPSGSPLIVGGFVSTAAGQVRSYTLSDGGATPAPGGPASAGDALPYTCRFSQDGRHLYAGGYGESAIAGFRVDAASGALSPLPGSPYSSGLSYPTGYAADSAGRLFAATGGPAGGPVAALIGDDGALVPAGGSPFSSGLGQALDGLWHPAGFYLAGDYLNGKIGVYRVQGAGAATTLAAVSGSPFSAGQVTGTAIMALNRTGALLFAANVSTRNITTLLVNPSTGALSLMDVQAQGSLAPAVSGMAYAAAPPASRPAGYLYALRDMPEGNQIYGYRAGPDGVLAPLGGFPVASGGGSQGLGGLLNERLSYDPVHSRLFVLNDQSDSLSVFQVDLATGALSPLPYSPVALGPGVWACVRAHPDGGSAALSGLDPSGRAAAVRSLRVTALAAALTAPAPTLVGGADGLTCAYSPAGDSFYVGGVDIGAFRVDPDSAGLTPRGGSPFSSGAAAVAGLAVDASGRLLLAEPQLAEGDPPEPINTPAVHAFTADGGQLSPVAGNPFETTIPQPAQGLSHPAGFYLLTSPAHLFFGVLPGSAVGVFRVSGAGAATRISPLSSLPPEAAPPTPFFGGLTGMGALALDHSGERVYIVNNGISALTSFSFDPASGELTGLSTQPRDTIGGPNSNTSGLAHVPVLPDLTLSMSSASSFAPGSEASYALRVANISAPSAAAAQVLVSSDLPAGLSYRGVAGPGWSCSASGQAVGCRHPGPLAGGAALPELLLRVGVAADLERPPLSTARVSTAGELASGNNQAAFTSAPAGQSISFAPLPPRRLGDPPFALQASASSGLPVLFSSATPATCAVSAGVVSLLSPGTCTIVARQPGGPAYAPAAEVRRSFAVGPAEQRVYLPLLRR